MTGSKMDTAPGAATDRHTSRSRVSFLITFALMFGTWIVLSGKFEALLLVLGLISSFLVAWFFHDLLFPTIAPNAVAVFVRFCRYAPWLILEIIKANFHLLYVVCHPRMHEIIDPHIIQFDTGLTSDLAITTLANSITLTPGTITITAGSDGIFRVHAIDRPSADALPGAMLDRVADVYGDNR